MGYAKGRRMSDRASKDAHARLTRLVREMRGTPLRKGTIARVRDLTLIALETPHVPTRPCRCPHSQIEREGHNCRPRVARLSGPSDPVGAQVAAWQGHVADLLSGTPGRDGLHRLVVDTVGRAAALEDARPRPVPAPPAPSTRGRRQDARTWVKHVCALLDRTVAGLEGRWRDEWRSGADVQRLESLGVDGVLWDCSGRLRSLQGRLSDWDPRPVRRVRPSCKHGCGRLVPDGRRECHTCRSQSYRERQAS